MLAARSRLGPHSLHGHASTLAARCPVRPAPPLLCAVRPPLMRLQRRAASTAAAEAAGPAAKPLLMSDERITAPAEYNRWLQLPPACTAGLSIGTYFAIPGCAMSTAFGSARSLPTLQ